jgi:hypothetical protein
MVKSTSRFQPNHAGHHTPVAVTPGMVVSHQSHGVSTDRPAAGGNIARDSTRGKHVGPVPVHPASHRVTGTNIGAPEVTTLSAIPDASNPNALDPTRPGKSFVGKMVNPVPGQRSRTGDLEGQKPGANFAAHNARAVAEHAARVELGRRVIGEALDCAEPDHPALLGR